VHPSVFFLPWKVRRFSLLVQRDPESQGAVSTDKPA
jgi:hypothetical protein